MTEQQETSLQNETDRSKTGQSKTQKPQTQPDIKERFMGVGIYLSIIIYGYITMKIYNKLTYVDTSLDMYKDFFTSIIVSFFVAFVISLVQWFFIRKHSTFVNQIGKAYFNFCISMVLWNLIIILALGLAFLAVGKVIDTQELEPSILFIIFSAPVLVLLLVFIFLIFSLIGAVMAGFGKVFHVPMSFKILR
ncbi:DUF4870 domain-containing protein [Staphylococcus pettenkoferi]|uniref:DUF4870 domain-containing protein n=1 Tax=Staphylococcus pettenkoferi TaxID=170573 RepID=A0ABT4BNP4_9STAP|nr:DUF4870 domain-containing protein [Staphylococcus pettenkoferi]MCY1564163.1 DUF4870 domain-containing protein [Staphylococcus pettenkoferi]MCY1571312.1 DUF4870 domain-containing protein [Staphylococcus pettenkoferi]MCY1584311.1 DUF4870 domain-containing protein [Staphylococcus pettenkoferi]MCY1591932.1 DUF4870 domain-containing protein [Staphylococcus pettenkoferi]MCY1606711.1 DUF4870 domain-containing protein [Staphylococcus pettenkoferi]